MQHTHAHTHTYIHTHPNTLKCVHMHVRTLPTHTETCMIHTCILNAHTSRCVCTHKHTSTQGQCYPQQMLCKTPTPSYLKQNKTKQPHPSPPHIPLSKTPFQPHSIYHTQEPKVKVHLPYPVDMCGLVSTKVNLDQCPYFAGSVKQGAKREQGKPDWCLFNLL